MRTKYNARKTTVGCQTFDSKKEAARYVMLKAMENNGNIKCLELQPSFVLQEGFIYNGKKERPIVYRADFRYIICSNSEVVVEDVKGMKTDVYRLKRKLFLKKYGDAITFREV